MKLYIDDLLVHNHIGADGLNRVFSTFHVVAIREYNPEFLSWESAIEDRLRTRSDIVICPDNDWDYVPGLDHDVRLKIMLRDDVMDDDISGVVGFCEVEAYASENDLYAAQRWDRADQLERW